MNYSEVALQRVREERLLIDQVDQWLYEEIEPYLGQRVLELGCGMGNFAHHLTDRELYIGTDIAADSVAHVRHRFRSYPNIKVFVADAAGETLAELHGLNIDTVFSLNVLEHIQDDEKAVKNVWRVLQPGGMFILVVPAHKWLYGSIDRAIGHYRRYDKQTIAALLEGSSFHIVEQLYINALGALGWLFCGRILRYETPPSGQLRLFNRLVRMLRWFETCLEVPFGISVMTVSRKVEPFQDTS